MLKRNLRVFCVRQRSQGGTVSSDNTLVLDLAGNDDLGWNRAMLPYCSWRSDLYPFSKGKIESNPVSIKVNADGDDNAMLTTQKSPSEVKCLGWERNAKGQLLPRVVNMKVKLLS